MSIEVSQSFFEAQETGSEPLVIFTLDNAYGRYVFSDRTVSDELWGLFGMRLADGTFLANGGILAGADSYQVLAWGSMVGSYGRIRESLSPRQSDLLGGLKEDEMSSLTIKLNDTSGLFYAMEATQNILTATGEVRVGFAGLESRNFIRRFKGIVQSYKMDQTSLTLKMRAV